MLVNSRKCVNEIVYFRLNPYRKQCELMCFQIVLYYSFHVSLGDKTKKWYDLFCVWQFRFVSHTDILSFLSFLCYFCYYCETKDTADVNLDLWLRHLWKTILTHGTRIILSLSMAVRKFSVSACLPYPRIKLLSQTVHHCYKLLWIGF